MECVVGQWFFAARWSHGESNYVIQGGPEIRDFNLDQVMNQEFLVSEMQRVLCAVDSFEQITKRHMRRNGGFRT